ncbi:hypothetical protein OKJ48_44210 [Streptomyces kunmingensis]|uniref:Uncharacterized protein n=1 Tax=Streptomyces kunmingensis TaxID=68225 RepID=A0ABU6CR44_9ACTN|nr:hypothetical protein [Streptomyces kunmingensis]MEB3967193.1 hypothetical protein [Streptomyces kunmingensis]
MNDEVRQRLRDAADAHRPDREGMLARIERGMSDPLAAPAGQRRPAVGWVRIAGATAGVAAALAVGGFAVGAALRQDDGPRQTVAVTPTPSAVPTPTADATSRGPEPSDSPASTHSSPVEPPTPHHPASEPARPPAGTKATTPAATATTDGPLWSDGSIDPGSNDYWAQSDITFKTKDRLTALTVELRVAQTGEVSDTGNWRSLSAEDFTVSVAEGDGFLVYRWVLKAGRTVPAGEYVFAGQYDHAQGGRDAGGDTYSVSARTEEGDRAAVGGDFA